MSAIEQIENFIRSTKNGCSLFEISRAFSLRPNEQKKLLPLLDGLKDRGIFKAKNGKYGTEEQLGLIRGVLECNERGFAFLSRSDGNGSDLFIPKKYLFGAHHKDEVLCSLTGESDDAAAVEAVLRRGYTEIVGTVFRERGRVFLYPDEKRYLSEIFLGYVSPRAPKDGVKAVVKITDYPERNCPSGEIVELLGRADDFFAEELSILRAHGLKEEFSKQAEKEAAINAQDFSLDGLTDLTFLPTITIDGEDTRDIDDAVSVERTKTGYRLGVHIADVSHFVPYRSALDKEAFSRGTSVYFPDRVLPMLPRVLSNGVCSLKENLIRRTLSAIVEFDENGNELKSEIVPSFIRSRHQATYTEIGKVLSGDEEAKKKYADVLGEIFDMAELCKILNKKRKERGAVDLLSTELKIVFDGEKVEIPPADDPFPHLIIEEFMIAANECVARFLLKAGVPAVFRVHEKPSAEKAETLSLFASSLGLSPRFSLEEIRPSDYSALLAAARDLPAYPVLNDVMLRSMQKAKYAPVNIGHFGLASEAYLHFTSPIRRYPDLCVHRIVKEFLKNGKQSACDLFAPFVGEASVVSSEKEKNATEAERDVDALYTVLYMSDKIGKTFDAVLSGVSEFSLYARFENGVEGYIPVETLDGEYTFHPDLFALKGKKNYALGDKVKIEVVGVDYYARKTLFSVVDEKKGVKNENRRSK